MRYRETAAPSRHPENIISRAHDGDSMSNNDKAYGDTADQVILTTPANLFDQWTLFEHQMFSSLNADTSIARRVMLNAGAGRQVPDVELPLFNSFERAYLLEPDDSRRAALAENTKDARVELLADRIEQLDVSHFEPADFVQCKYVLQHIHTDVLPLAIEKLKSAVAKNGVIAIFSSSSAEDSYFRMRVPEEAQNNVPAHLRADANDLISRTQFNQLVAEPQSFPFIATHHIGRQMLLDFFAGWNPTLEVSSWGAVFLRARRPA